MNRLQSLWQMLKYFALSAFCWLALYETVLAKAMEEIKEDPNGGWTLPYGLIMMGIVLGMLVLCRPSGRRDRAKVGEKEEKTEKRVSQAEMVEEDAKKEKKPEDEKRY